jgi:hypothetical protein
MNVLRASMSLSLAIIDFANSHTKQISVIKEGSAQRIHVCGRQCERGTLVAVRAIDAYSDPHQCSFTVNFLTKGARTAVGFMSKGISREYMQVEPIGEEFVSFGGAGFLHPMESRARVGYREGDRVSCAVDFQAQKVRFCVNGALVGEAPWTSPEAFAAISIDRSDSQVDSDLLVTFGYHDDAEART